MRMFFDQIFWAAAPDALRNTEICAYLLLYICLSVGLFPQPDYSSVPPITDGWMYALYSIGHHSLLGRCPVHFLAAILILIGRARVPLATGTPLI